MTLDRRSRVAVIGIDGFVPSVAEALAAEGMMPALSQIVARGARVRLVSTAPATTPVAWAAMATGCHPDVNGIEGFLLHRPGRQIGDRISGITANSLTAEPIWDTAALNGRKAFVVKFPLSYPSALPALRIDGAAGWGGVTCLHELTAACTSRLGKGLEPAPPWSGGCSQWRAVRFARLVLANHWSGPQLVLHIAFAWAQHGDVPQLMVASEPSWKAVVVTAAAGVISEQFATTASGRRGAEEVSLRLKLTAWPDVKLGTDLEGFEVFATAAHATSGHSHPASIFARHAAVAGPIEEECDPSLLFSGEVDMATHFERCRLSAEWLARISRSILTQEEWDLFLVQAHFVDWAHHILEGSLDARHPLHDPARRPEAEGFLRAFYAMADELIAQVVEAAGSEANVIVMGDHGQDLHHTTFRTNAWLRNEGFLFGGEGDIPVDWTRSRALALGNSIYLNIKGREPEGIVDPGDAPALSELILTRLMRLSDPRTGERPVLIAGPKEHFAWLGAAGRGMGDCLFFLISGYQARNDTGALFTLTNPWLEFTSGHDHFWPLDPRIHTALYAAGPIVANRVEPLPLASITDVAPTISALLQMDAPFHARGRVLTGLLRSDVCDAFQPVGEMQ